MNDLDMVRELRAGVPEPSSATTAHGRIKLTAAIQASAGTGQPRRGSMRTRRPRGSTARRLAAVVAVTAAAATVTIAAITGNGGSQRGHHLANRPTTTKPFRAVLAAKVLRLAAAAAASNRAAEPAAGQWFFSKTVDYEFSQKPATMAYQEWGTFDGRYTAYHQGSQLIVHRDPAPIGGGGPTALDRFDFAPTPRTAYRALASLPTSPAALLAVISAHVAKLNPDQVTSPIEQYAPTSESQIAFNYLVDLMWNASDGEPPLAQASVYLAMAQMPNVSVQRGITDAAGQPAIGLSDNGGTDQLLLDPHTYNVVGIREVSTGVSPFYVPSRAQMIKDLLAHLRGRQLAEMKAEIKKDAGKMWQRVKAQNARPWPHRGAVVESLAIAQLTPVSHPGEI